MKLVLCALCASFMFGQFAYSAGKVEEVQKAVKESCQKDLGNADALRYVKDLFLSCTPKTQVEIEGCKVPCLKENAGAVVGS